MDGSPATTSTVIDGILGSSAGFEYAVEVRERGAVERVASGVVRASGLPTVGFEEIVRFEGGELGMVLSLERSAVGIVLLDDDVRIDAGTSVMRTGRVMDVPVGAGLLGRVVDAVGRPLDGGPTLDRAERSRIEHRPPSIVDRAPVHRPLATGITVVDALVPIGRGQRELILGDRQTGKTTLAVDAMLHLTGRRRMASHRSTVYRSGDGGPVAVYCAIGQRNDSVARVIATLREEGAMRRTVVVAAGGEHPVGLRFVAPYTAMTIAEWFMDRGRDVLVVFDDLTRHARAYRELSLLLRRPPGREAYPGDVFHLHARLLERAAQLGPHRGAGSITALPIIETQAENLAAYIPTNLISITDGQIYLSPRAFRLGQLPAVDLGRSVSRVGGDAQPVAYRRLAGPLRLAHARFEELERFTRYGARLDPARRRELERGRRVRHVLRQRPGERRDAVAQLVVLTAVTEGMLDDVPVDRVDDVVGALVARSGELGGPVDALAEDRPLTSEERLTVDRLVREIAFTDAGGGWSH